MTNRYHPPAVEGDEFGDPLDWGPGENLNSMLGSWQVQRRSTDKGQYTDYVGLIDRSTLQRLNTLDDIFPDAVFKSDEHRDVVLGYYEIGLQQLYAECNNREPILRRVRAQLKALDNCIVADSIEGYSGDDELLSAELEVYARMQDGKLEGHLTGLRDALEQRERELIWAIRKDQADDVYRDYSDVRLTWEKAVAAGESVMGARVGQIMDHMPEFIQMAASMSRATESNTRRIHIQSILARVTERMTTAITGRGSRGRQSVGEEAE